MRSKNPRKILLATVLAAFVGLSASAQTTVSYDFNDGMVPGGTMIPTTPSAGTLNPFLGVTNAGGFANSGCLILNRSYSGESFGQWWITTNLLNGDAVSGFTATFKLWIGNGTGGSAPVPHPGGNGVIFHVGPQPPAQYTGGASTWGNGLDITFRSYSSTPVYGLHVYHDPVTGTFHPGAGTQVAASSFISYFDTNGVSEAFSNYVDVTITLNYGVLNVSYSNAVLGNVVAYSNLVIPGFSPLTGIGGTPAVFGFTCTDGSGAHEDAWIDEVRLTASASTGPIGIVTQPASQTNAENMLVTFNVGVTGAPPYFYQWLSNSVPIPDATNASYTTPLTLYAMNGNHYAVIASNIFNSTLYSVTSADAILTIVPDTNGVQVLSVGCLDGSSVGVLFSSYIDAATAGSPTNYLVNGVQPAAAQVRTAFANYGNPLFNYTPSYLKTVRLTPAAPVSGSFTVTVKSNLLSRTGVRTAETTLTGIVAGMTDVELGTPGSDPFAAGEAFSGGSNRVEVIGGGSNLLPLGGAGSDAANFAYNTTPRTGNFDVAAKLYFETLTANNAKAGVMVRPNPTDASSPAVAIKVFPPTPGQNQYETPMRASSGSAAISWAAPGAPANGNVAANWATVPYGGGNWIRIRSLGGTYYGYAGSDGLNWQLIGQVTPDTFNFPAQEYVGLYVSAANNDGRLCEADFSDWGPVNFPAAVVSITNNLRSNYTNSENGHQIFTIGASVSAAPAGELVYQWQRAEPGSPTLFVDLPAANSNSYTTPLLTVANDNNANYRVICFAGDIITGHSVTSSVTTLRVNLDTVPPYMIAAAADATFTQITITFDGPIDPNSTYDTSHYTLTPVGGGSAISVFSATPVMNADFTYTKVLLTLGSSLTALTKYNLAVADILDLGGNNINNTTQPGGKLRVVTGWVLAYGYLKYERWTGPSYPSGAGPYSSFVESLLNNSKFSGPPDITQVITYSGYPNGDLSNPGVNAFDFGARISGFFIPSTTASYQWYVRGNDGTALWVSSSSTAPNPSTDTHKAAANSSFSSPGASWAASQTNLAIVSVSGFYPDITAMPMTAGQLYALTALEQQGNGSSFIEFTCGTDGATTLGGVSITNTPGGAYPTAGRGGAATNAYNLTGTNIATYVNPDLSIITANGPTNLFVEHLKVGTFVVSATAQVSAGGTPSSVGPILYQWYLNSSLISGATNSTYTTPQIIYPGPTNTYSVVMTVPGLPFMTVTNSALLSPIPDNTRPFVVAQSSFGGNTICLRFDGLLNGASVTNGTYTVTGAAITSARLLADGITVVLTLDQKLSGSTFSLTVTGVQDAAGNLILPGTIVTGSLQNTQIAAAIDIGVGTNAAPPGVVQTNTTLLTNVTFDVNYASSTVMVTNGQFEIQASGANIGGGLRQDGFHFVYERRAGDFDVVVRIDGLTVADRYTRAGLMVRENLSPGSRRYSIVADPPNTPAADGTGNGQNSVELDYRSTQDGLAAGWPNNPSPPSLGQGATVSQIPGIWLRLKLVGNKVYAYTSADQTNWALVGRDTLPADWSKTNYLGMCVTAHALSQYTAARLSNYGDYRLPATKQALYFVNSVVNVPPGSPNGPQQTSDTFMYNQLLALGYNVQCEANLLGQAEDAEGKSVIVWSSSGTSGDLGNPLCRMAAVPVPLLTWENGGPQKLNLSTGGGGTVAGKTTINITNTTSPLAMGLSGPVTVSASATYMRVAKANLAAGMSVIASQDTDASQAVFFACDKGAALTGANGGPSLAPQRRVGLFLDDATAALLTTTGLQLVTNAIQWAAAGIAADAPTILTQPANVNVPAGGPATFLVTAAGGAGPYTYQWAKIVSLSPVDIPNATNRDYTIFATTLGDSGGYQVKITALGSSLSVTSSIAQLNVINTTPGSIGMSVSGGNLNISWPSDHTGWRLQVQTNSLTGAWYTWPNSTNFNSLSIPIDVNAPAVYYRLVYP